MIDWSSDWTCQDVTYWHEIGVGLREKCGDHRQVIPKKAQTWLLIRQAIALEPITKGRLFHLFRGSDGVQTGGVAASCVFLAAKKCLRIQLVSRFCFIFRKIWPKRDPGPNVKFITPARNLITFKDLKDSWVKKIFKKLDRMKSIHVDMKYKVGQMLRFNFLPVGPTLRGTYEHNQHWVNISWHWRTTLDQREPHEKCYLDRSFRIHKKK